MKEKREKIRKVKFPRKSEIRAVFRGKEGLEEIINYELPFFCIMTKKKQKRIYDVINTKILSSIRAKKFVLNELFEKRRASANISFGDLDSFSVHWRNLNEKPKIARSIYAGKDLLGENIGQEYEGGGYIGIEEKREALKELVKDKYVLEIPYNALEITEIREKYYISIINDAKKLKAIMEKIDIPGLGKLTSKMQAALKCYKKIEDPSLRTYLTSGGHIKDFRD